MRRAMHSTWRGAWCMAVIAAEMEHPLIGLVASEDKGAPLDASIDGPERTMAQRETLINNYRMKHK